MKLKRIVVFFLIILLPVNFTGCYFNNKASNEKQLNIYVGVKDKESLNIIKLVTDAYRKSNPDLKLNINNVIGDQIESSAANGNDIIFISREDMMNLAPKGLISDMKNYYENSSVIDGYYSVVKAYGRFNDRYYGIPVIPYTLEFLYNKKSLARLNIEPPKTMKQFNSILKKFNDRSQKIPAVLNEDMDINDAVFSLTANNKMLSMRNLENIYNSSKEKYEKLPHIQEIFSDINNLVKNNVINKNTFELGNESSVEKFDRGDIPMILMSSYYIKDLKSQDVYSIAENVTNMKVPIISDSLICVPTNASNTEGISDFIKFVFDDKMQDQLLKTGYVTGNRKINSKNQGIKKIVSSHIENSTEDNIAIIYNIPQKIKYNISPRIEDILLGKYNGKEWKEIINES